MDELDFLFKIERPTPTSPRNSLKPVMSTKTSHLKYVVSRTCLRTGQRLFLLKGTDYKHPQWTIFKSQARVFRSIDSLIQKTKHYNLEVEIYILTDKNNLIRYRGESINEK